MDIHFIRTVLTAPGDHPRWETDLLARLADVPARETAAARAAPAPGPDSDSLFVTPRRARE